MLDPLGALLLTIRPQAGIALTVAIMVADVSINAIAFGHLGLLSPAIWFLWVQSAFGLFALFCAPRVWRAGSSTAASTATWLDRAERNNVRR